MSESELAKKHADDDIVYCLRFQLREILDALTLGFVIPFIIELITR